MKRKDRQHLLKAIPLTFLYTVMLQWQIKKHAWGIIVNFNIIGVNVNVGVVATCKALFICKKRVPRPKVAQIVRYTYYLCFNRFYLASAIHHTIINPRLTLTALEVEKLTRKYYNVCECMSQSAPQLYNHECLSMSCWKYIYCKT